MSTIYLKSTFEAPSEAVKAAAADGKLVIVEQSELTADRLLAHKGLITGNQLDQNAMVLLRDALAAFLDAGGRWFFNGHMVRPLVEGLGQYQPIQTPSRADFDLSSINAHPLFAGIEFSRLETNKGVAGFYGRGAIRCRRERSRSTAWGRPGPGRLGLGTTPGRSDLLPFGQ